MVHARNIADTHGERAKHRNRLRAGGKGVAEQTQSLRGVTGNRGVTHTERGDFGAAAVVAVHRLLGNFAGYV